MRIAIVGAQGTGKTTLLRKIKESGALNGEYAFIDEIVRNLVKERGVKINEEGDYGSQLLILQAHKDNAIKYIDMVTDRSCLDAFSYALYNNTKGFFTDEEMSSFEKIFTETLKLYDKVFYIPVEFDIVSDNFRSTDKEFQKGVSSVMEFILEEYSVDFIELRGSVEERLQIFKDNLTEKKEKCDVKEALRVLWMDPKELIQCKENNKDHRDNLDAIIESLQLFGWQFPLLIAQDKRIISGHGRVQAAIKLKMSKVPVIISNMSDKVADEFRITDNVTQAAGKIDMVKVTQVLKNMEPKSKHLRNIKSIVNDISQIRHWMEDYLDPKNPNRNKAVDDAFKRARKYQDEAGVMYTAPNKGCEGLKVTGKPRHFQETTQKIHLNQF